MPEIYMYGWCLLWFLFLPYVSLSHIPHAKIIVFKIAVVGNGIIVISSNWLSRPVNPYHRLCVSLAAADTWAASLLATGEHLRDMNLT